MLFFSTGVQLLIFVPYNFSWTINLTMEELFSEVLKMRGTTWPSFCMTFIIFGYTSSIYHLMYIGMERLYAIMKPLSYRMQTKRAVILGLSLIWILSLISSTVPR